MFDLVSKEKDILNKEKKFFLYVSIILLSYSIIQAGQDITIIFSVNENVAG
jgi:hypothetical protein